jgi:flagellar M-ring protein FliF
MNEWMTNIWEQISALPPQRRMILALAAVGSLSFFYWLSQGLGSKDYRSLYRGLEEQEVARVVEALRAEKIDYRLEDAGTAVAVPAEQVHEARIRIAGRGLPGGSASGFELFDKPAFGVTDFVHRINYTRAVQGELARSIEQLDPIEGARVQVVIPERKGVLAANTRKPSAAVVVRLVPGRTLDSNQARAVVHLVASSIESLDPADVTIVDDAGRLLAPQGESSAGTLAPGGAPAHQQRVEAELARRIETILEPVVGMGGVVARVRAEMDWTESEVTEERYDPNSQVARSESRTDEFESSPSEGGRPGVVANATGEGGGLEEGAAGSKRTLETFNYEISKTVSHSVRAMGEVQRLSVAVLVDSGPSAAGTADLENPEEPAWPPEALDRFEQLAMQAVGFSKERGDQIVVSSAPFRTPELQAEEGFAIDPEWMIFGSQTLRILAQLLGLVLFARFVVKPFLGVVSDTAQASRVALPAPVSALQAELEGGSAGAPMPIPAAPLTLAEQVGREAEARTDDSVTTIRNWLNQG